MREGSSADEDLLLQLFDEAVAWLVARGQIGQWGSDPFSSRRDARDRVRSWAIGGGLRIVERDGDPVGALVVGSAPDYVPPVVGSELYVLLVLTARRHAGEGIGGRLIAIADQLARSRGREQLRVDCWADAPTLVRWYERQGFIRSDTFELRGWRGQVLTRRVGVDA